MSSNMTKDGKIVLCGANAYEKKYFFNNEFEKLPESIQEDIHIISVLFTEEVGGIFLMAFDDDGELVMQTESDPDDFYYDDVSAGLLVQQIKKSKQELFESLKIYYRVFILKEDPSALLAELEKGNN